jgi:hypothetical protein
VGGHFCSLLIFQNGELFKKIDTDDWVLFIDVCEKSIAIATYSSRLLVFSSDTPFSFGTL